jgi:glycosyltransferase involved in cell wall biosynthesis
VLDGAIASRLLGLPHVLHYRGNTLDRPKAVFDILTRFWTGTSDRVYCISNSTAEIFRKRGLAAKVQALYNPVDVEAFRCAERSDDIRRQLGAGLGDILVGTVARIHPRKDIATFLRAGALAAKALPSLRLAVVGVAEVPEEIAYEGQMKALAEELGIAKITTWTGARRDMPAVLKALDIFVLCSRHEGFGRVVAEGMAAGLPMVLTNEGAFPELSQLGPRMFLASAEDAEGFSEGIVRASPSVELGDPQGQGLPLPGEPFAAEAIASSAFATYRSLHA